MSTNMTLITSVTVGSGGAASVTLPATGTIPQTYTDLKVVVSSRSARAGGQVSDGIAIQFNGSTSNLSMRYLDGNGSAASSSTDTAIWTRTSASGATASTFGNAEFYIPNYTSSNYKSVSVDGVSENNATSAFTMLSAGLWSNTAAITSIRLISINSENLVEGTTAYLYGISSVTSTTKATGGIVSSDGTYNYHMFPYSGTFTPTQALSADILCVAGGGGGAYGAGGGGGGAGGLLAFTSQSLTATGYTVTVGAGGSTPSSGGIGGAGGNSQFGSLTASVGGGGGGWRTTAAGNGGSGGGAGAPGSGNGTAGTATSGQGNNGGASNSSGYRSGGGGGAGAVGANATSSQNGAGGIGATSSLINAIAVATQTGQNSGSDYYYAGGGGAGGVGSGAGVGTSAGGLGGIGGGGRGALASGQTGLAGLPNTGGGGGSGWTDSVDTAGGQGGSGLVIIRYAI